MKEWMKLPLLPGLIVAVLMAAMFDAQAGQAGERNFPRADAKPKPHLVCELTLRNMTKSKQQLTMAITKNDIKSLRKNLEELAAGLKTAESCMNREMLLGAWKTPRLKKESHQLMDRLETIKILNFISLAFTSPYYSNPTGKVSHSVADSIAKFFTQLEYLLAGIETVNSKVGKG